VTPELLADRERSLVVACPLEPCGAQVGEPCVSLTTRRPHQHLGAHDARLKAAGVLHAPLDPRELAWDPDREFRRW
jgi:hypothetical protein